MRTKRVGKTVHTVATFVRELTDSERQGLDYTVERKANWMEPCVIRTVHGERLLYTVETPPRFSMPAPWRRPPLRGTDLEEWRKRALAWWNTLGGPPANWAV